MSLINMLDIYAGTNAKKILERDGFKSSHFSAFLGASGGPKWFTLFGLDKYLFGEFFKDRQQNLDLIGSSAGAFRAACFAQQDPVAAISRLAQYYSETVYSNNVTPAEISTKARVLLQQVLGESGAREIIDNQIFKAHFIVAKTKGLVATEKKPLQLAGLLQSYALNRVNRRLLRKQYERYVYQNPRSSLEISDAYKFNTHYVDLTEENLQEALLASGSIPLVMQGIRNIPGSPTGMYRDGGIIDYHFDIKLNNQKGLTLYPHFNANPKAGWFDKGLKRNVSPDNYCDIVMLVPSQRFISQLPMSKIPDREDFTKLSAPDRIAYWQTVLRETERLAEFFNLFLIQPDIVKIKTLD